jgi:hypothetical protein
LLAIFATASLVLLEILQFLLTTEVFVINVLEQLLQRQRCFFRLNIAEYSDTGGIFILDVLYPCTLICLLPQ